VKQLIRPLVPRFVRRAYKAALPRGPLECSYVYSPEHSVVNDFAEFSGESVEMIAQRIRGFEMSVCREWSGLGAIGFVDGARKFYASSTSYVYDLLSANYNPAAVKAKLDKCTPEILDTISRHSGSRFLEFGGGLGLVCQLAAEMGKEVTYLDIPGRISDFARWRFARYEIPVQVQIVEPGHLDELVEQDIIFSDAVLEHLAPAEQERVLKILAKQLAPGGTLVLLVDLSGESKHNPTHAPVDIHRLHAVLGNEKLSCRLGEKSFYSIWDRSAAPVSSAGAVVGR
jgi:SAM-dependent methyltransferase